MKKKKSTIAMIFAIIVFAISSTAFDFQNDLVKILPYSFFFEELL